MHISINSCQYLLIKWSHYKIRNTFEAVARLCLKIAYGNFDEEVGGYKEESEISALEKYAAKFGPSFPVKAYSKVLKVIIYSTFR